jgi:hypothetical protein
MKSLLGHYDSGSGSEDEEPQDVQLQDEELGPPPVSGPQNKRQESPSDQNVISDGDDTPEEVSNQVDYHRSLMGKKPEAIKIPEAPRGAVDPSIQEKMSKLKEKKEWRGMDMKQQIQKRKDFRNPSIYEKLIDHRGIDEFGSNFPPETFDPHAFDEDSYYEKLSLAQKVLMDSVAKDVVSGSNPSSSTQSDKPKVVEIITGTAKKSSTSTSHSNPSSVEAKRKKMSKWDEAPPTKQKLND